MYLLSLVVQGGLQEVGEGLIVDHFWLWGRSDELQDAVVDLDSYIDTRTCYDCVQTRHRDLHKFW